MYENVMPIDNHLTPDPHSLQEGRVTRQCVVITLPQSGFWARLEFWAHSWEGVGV